MKVDPTFTFWLGVVTSILQGISKGTVLLTNMIPADAIPYVMAWISFLSFVNTVILTALIGVSSIRPGPLAAAPTLPEARAVMAEAQKAATVFLLAVVLVGAFVSGAHAQPTPKPRPATAPPSIILPSTPLICDPLNLIPGCKQNPINGPTGASVDMTKLWDQILAAAVPDLEYAMALANASGNPGGAIRAKCYTALIGIAQKAGGADLKNADGSAITEPPAPHLVTDAEKLAQVIDNLAPTGPLVSECAAAAQAVKMNVLVFVGAILSGAAGLSVLGGT